MVALETANFLNTIIFSNSFLFLNYWSLIHFASGYILMKYIVKRKNYRHLLILLIAYEIFEYLTIALGFSLFRTEIGLDTFYDLIIGMFGGWLYKTNRKV